MYSEGKEKLLVLVVKSEGKGVLSVTNSEGKRWIQGELLLVYSEGKVELF